MKKLTAREGWEVSDAIKYSFFVCAPGYTDAGQILYRHQFCWLDRLRLLLFGVCYVRLDVDGSALAAAILPKEPK